MKMPIINFDERFADYMSEWMKNHQDQYATFDDMEEDMPRIYVAFLNTRAKWLGNVTPGAYFTQFEDPKVLVDWLAQYCEEGAPVPDLLMEQITTVGRPCEKRLLELLKDEEATEEAKMIAINLLREMESVLPKMLYITWQLNREGKDELKDNALESLTAMGECVVQPVLQELPKANAAGEEALLEVNLEAAREISRQIRLRNLSGIIIIDFINLKSAANSKRIMEELRIYTAKDPIRTQVVDMTKLGLVEMTRQKIELPLAEIVRISN